MLRFAKKRMTSKRRSQAGWIPARMGTVSVEVPFFLFASFGGRPCIKRTSFCFTFRLKKIGMIRLRRFLLISINRTFLPAAQEVF